MRCAVSCSEHDMFYYYSILEPEGFHLSFFSRGGGPENIDTLSKVTDLANCVEFLEKSITE